MLWHLYMASAMLARLPSTKTNFRSRFEAPPPVSELDPEEALSSALKVALTEKRVLKGRTAIIITIMMGNMEMVLPEEGVKVRVRCLFQ